MQYFSGERQTGRLPSLDARFRHPAGMTGIQQMMVFFAGNARQGGLIPAYAHRNRGAARPCPLRGRAAPLLRALRSWPSGLTPELGRSESRRC